MSDNIIWLGFIASALAGMATGIGALAVFALRRISTRSEDVLLSSAAGIMLAATFFSLIQPGIDYGEAQFDATWLAVAVVIAGIFIGAWALFIIHQYLPHEHFISGPENVAAADFERIWLFVIAIALHNFPEGMAVGVGFAGGDIGNGVALATGIGLQNIPEGLAVAVSMRAIDYSRWQSFWLAFLTGLVEPVGGLFGAAAVSLAAPLMPWTLGFAAGAMLFIISNEIIPETHRGGHQNLATFSLIGGFGLMMFLDATLA